MLFDLIWFDTHKFNAWKLFDYYMQMRFFDEVRINSIFFKFDNILLGDSDLNLFFF